MARRKKEGCESLVSFNSRTGMICRHDIKESLRGRVTGFTLTEMLVVMLVLALLAALLLPSLSKARAKAHSVLCLNNVKQWSLAFWMYGDDHEDFFPYEGNPSDINSGLNLNAWYNSATEYVSQPKLKDLYLQGRPPVPGVRSIFVCPRTQNTPPAKLTVANAFFMYGFNNRMDPNGEIRFRRSQVLQPAETVLFTENSEDRFPSTSGRFTPARHSHRANLGFVDGHAEGVHQKDFRRTALEDGDARAEWSQPRKVYWYPYPGAPN